MWAGIEHELVLSIVILYSREFSRGNIFRVFNNQIYSWKNIRGLQLGAISIKP